MTWRSPILPILTTIAVAMSAAEAKPLDIVAAENFYGDIARQVGGPAVAVTSILSSPDQDPHEFETSPSVARELAQAELVIYNGADYDPWVTKSLAASLSSSRKSIMVAALLHKRPGDNPHLWYDPETATALARNLIGMLVQLDREHAADYRRRLAMFEHSMKPIFDKVAEMRRKYAGTAVTATEPIFGYMADALGLDMRNHRFQVAIMNDTEPSAAEIARFEADLRSHAVKALIYNKQASGALTRRMLEIARQSGIPVVPVTETEPAGMDYQMWMRSQLDALDRALSH